MQFIIEKNVFDDKLAAVVVPTNVSTEVLPDISKESIVKGEVVWREIFNAGANNAYWAYGRQCDNLSNFSGYIIPGQQLEVTTLESVNVFSVGGCTIARAQFRRMDLVPHKNILTNNPI